MAYINRYKIKYNTLNLKNDNYNKSECDFCTNYGFFSYYNCQTCSLRYCLNHNIQCKCKERHITLYLRDLNI